MADPYDPEQERLYNQDRDSDKDLVGAGRIAAPGSSERLHARAGTYNRAGSGGERLHRASDGADSSDSPETLAQKEQGMHDRASDPNTQKPFDKEFAGLTNSKHFNKDGEDPGDNKLGAGYTQNTPGRSGGKGLRALVTRRGFLVGGAILSAILFVLILTSSFSAFELINLRENLLSHGNRFTNRTLQHRRAASFANILKKLNAGTLEENINNTKFADAFRERGFDLSFDEKTGKLLDFSFEASDGKGRAFDFDSKNFKKAVDDFFGTNDTFGREASKAYDAALSQKGALWTGPFTRTIYKLFRFSFGFGKKLDAAASDKTQEAAGTKKPETPEQKIADAIRHADVEAPDDIQHGASASQLAEDHSTVGPDGKPVPAAALDGSDLLTSPSGETPASYQAKMLADPTATSEILGLGSAADQANVAGAVDNGLKSGIDLTPGEIAKAGGKGVLGGTIKGLSIIGAGQGACEAKGVLTFISNATNILMTIELARLAVNMLSAADSQKAGVLTAGGLSILMQYMHSGKGYNSAGGIQQLMGNPNVKVSSDHLLKTSVGRGHPGVLGTISNFINRVPGANKCSVINNGFVSAGGFVVGIAAAIFSGGTELVANVATAITISVVKEVAITIAIPLLIALSAHMLVDGTEDGSLVGDMLASGFGAFAGMTASGNGLRPITKKKLAEITPMVNADEQYALSQQSVFERYLSPSNGQSLLSQVASSMPKNIWSLMSSLSGGVQHLFGNVGNLGILNFLIPDSARAAAAPGTTCMDPNASAAELSANNCCDDPQVLATGVATDAFCNPIMAEAPDFDPGSEALLRSEGMIDGKGYPTDAKQGDDLSFSEYVQDCHSGRPSPLYNGDPDKDGNEPATDNTCVEAGTPLPGDTVGRYERFSAWYGYLADRDSIVEGFLQQ